VNAVPAEWFAVQTRYRFEKRVVAQLSHKNCEAYLPLLTEHHTWSDRQKLVTTPLFPGLRLRAYRSISRCAGSGVANSRPDRLRKFRRQRSGGAGEADEDLQLLLRERGLFSLHPSCTPDSASGSVAVVCTDWKDARKTRKGKATDLNRIDPAVSGD